MKKIIYLLLTIVLISVFMSGCSSNDKLTEYSANSNSLNIVTTIFPEYDWVKNVVGSNTNNDNITMLLDNGVDLHSYQPTAEDMMKISNCDLFIYVGGESDSWVDDALKNAVNKNMKVINLMDILGETVKEEKIVEGMEDDSDEDEEHSEVEYDEHIWLSLKNAQACTIEIANTLAEIDPANGDNYIANAKDYNEKLANLDNEYRNIVNNSSVKTLVFGDRFPFRYLADDYDLTYFAAFPGCSAETEASFETITFLASKIDELNLNYVMTLEKSDKKIAQTIINNTKSKNQKILQLNSMQSITSDDVLGGTDYISVMENNLSVLKIALY